MSFAVEKIDYLESQDDYVAVKSGGRSYLKEQPLGELETLLDPAAFVRIHRRYILNLVQAGENRDGDERQPHRGADRRHGIAYQQGGIRTGCGSCSERVARQRAEGKWLMAMRWECRLPGKTPSIKKKAGSSVISAPGPLPAPVLRGRRYACSPLGATDVRPQSSHCR